LINNVFRDNKNLSVSSIKPMIGHCMGAAGGMEAVSVVLSIKHNLIPPTINTEANEEGCAFGVVVGEALEKRINYAMSESFGFGGACSAIIFGRYEEVIQ
jgi:3-oxoacyl-[acyl-carrier-protein] synthase II